MQIVPAFAIVALALTQARAPSPDIHFVATPSAVVEAMLEVARVTSDDVIYDLGCGDGRIVITAAQKYGARGVGIEIDRNLIKTAKDRARKAGVSDKVTFIQTDLFKADLSDATVVTLYLSDSINMRLQPKFRRELKPGTRIVSHRFGMRNWPPEQELTVDKQKIYFWTVPQK